MVFFYMIGACTGQPEILKLPHDFAQTYDIEHFNKVDDKFLGWFIDKIYSICNTFIGSQNRSELKYMIASEFNILSNQINQMNLNFETTFKIEQIDNNFSLELRINEEQYSIYDLQNIKSRFLMFKDTSDKYEEFNDQIEFWNFKNNSFIVFRYIRY